jgi:hypothetical protein
MYATNRPDAPAGGSGGEGSRLPSDPLRKVSGQGGTLFETFQAIGYYQEEQERAAADLLEREIWAVSRMLIASAPIWNQNPGMTLSFPLNQSEEAVPYRMELGLFSHLAALPAPTPEEKELIASTTPCWARVAPNLERHLAGCSGALACSYVPVSMAEAVKLVGLDRIMDQMEAATRTAGQAVLNEARVQEDRRARLLAVERMFGWEADPGADPETTSMRTQLALAVLGRGSLGSLAPSAVSLGLATGAFYLFAGLAQALIVFLLGLALLVAWGLYVVHTTRGG